MKKIIYIFLLIIFFNGCSSNSENEESIQDSEPPIINLLGENPQELFLNEVYQELGAIATDNIDGDITNSITIFSNVNTAETGSYNVTYNVIDSSNNSSVASRIVNVTEPIIGTWTLINEEWVGPGTWPTGQARGCFLSSDEGDPDQFIFTETSVTKNVWECFQDGSLAEDLVVYGPTSWTNIGANSYLIDGFTLEVTFLEDNQMQIPFDDDILQTWIRN